MPACQTMDNVWEGSKQTLGLGDDAAAASETVPEAPALTKTPSAPAPVAAARSAAANTPTSAADPGRSLNSYSVDQRSFADEDKNFGVPPVSSLLPVGYHEPTPTTVAGGKLISTYDLHKLMTGGNQPVVINSLMGDTTELIPGSVWLSGAGNSGRFNDAVSRRLDERLQQLTGGNRDKDIVFYCLDVRCWLSYNAAIRATNLGYRNVYWYRGGLHAWNKAGLPHFKSSDDRW